MVTLIASCLPGATSLPACFLPGTLRDNRALSCPPHLLNATFDQQQALI